MSLSPNVTPFVPRNQTAKSSSQVHFSHSTLWKPSVDVAEFVPSWLNNEHSSSKEHNETLNNDNGAKNMSPKTGEKNGKVASTDCSNLIYYCR